MGPRATRVAGHKLAPLLLLLLLVGALVGAERDRHADQRRPLTCDTLLASSASLAAQCLCKDAADQRIGRLDCAARSSYAQLLADVGASPAAIDSLSLSGGLSAASEPVGEAPRRLQVDHLSLRLALGGELDGERADEQIGDTFKVVEAHELKFLSLALEADNCDRPLELRLASLARDLTALDRLELSADANKCAALRLDADTFGRQSRLKWLSLSSGGALTLGHSAPSPFGSLAALEHLDLQANNLHAFELFHHLAAARTSISSVNLAENQLRSLEVDFFALNESAARFELPSLSQLDLSHNKLAGLTLHEAQLILRWLPNLNQLYLQDNRISHLNLNALLTLPLSPAVPPTSGRGEQANEIAESRASRLELLDLSFNRLLKITGFSPHVRPTAERSTRIKSVNLAHNHLEKPIEVIDAKLIDRIVFRETLDLTRDDGRNLLAFDRLGLDLAASGPESTLCDFLSPSSHKSPVHGHHDDLVNEVILTNNKIGAIGPRDFSSNQCRQVQVLNLSRNRIRSIENSTFGLLRSLEHLDLSYNLLTNLSNNHLLVANRRLRLLNLSKNRLRSLGQDLLSHLLDLEELSLNENLLPELPSNFLRFNTKLMVLNLSRNKLKHLEEGIFSHLTQLKVLGLDGNQLRQFNHRLLSPSLLKNHVELSHREHEALAPRRWKPSDQLNQGPGGKVHGKSSPKHRQKLKDKRQHRRQTQEVDVIWGENLLVLSSNQIDLLTLSTERPNTNCSEFLRDAQVIWLDNNRLQRLSSDSFRCSPLVQKLHLRSNVISSIDAKTFERLSQLEYLDLSMNQLSQVQQKVFVPTTGLKHLDLSQNQLTQFKFSQIFSQLENLPFETLVLGSNTNLRLELNEFMRFLRKTQHSLRVLDLGQISGISHHQETSGSRLIQLDGDGLSLDLLNMSGVGNLPTGLLASLALNSFKLDRLDLSAMGGKEVEKSLIDFLSIKLENLLDLQLDDNQKTIERVLQEIENSSLSTLPLNRLSLRSNQLDSWPIRAKLASKLPQLSQLDISRNTLRHIFRSNLNDSWIDYQHKKLELLNVSYNALIGLLEHPTQKLSRLKSLMPRLRYLDLSHNRLTWIPFEFFDGLSDLILLKLDHNQLETLPSINTNSRLSLTLDLSSNPKLKSTGAKVASIEQQIDQDQSIVTDNFGLILAIPRGTDRVECSTINEYILGATDEGAQQIPYGDLLNQFNSSLADTDPNNAASAGNSACSQLIGSMDTIRFESSSMNLRESISMSLSQTNHRYLSMDLSNGAALGHNLIEQTNVTNQRVVILNLSSNKLQDSSQASSVDLCRMLSSLMTLDLSNNRFSDFPTNLTRSCSRLTYLDLSHNQIAKIADIIELRSLLVLRLSSNQLTYLDSSIRSNALRSLHLLDLRENPLKVNSVSPRIPSLKQILVDSIDQEAALTDGRVQIRVNGESSLILESTHELKFSLEVSAPVTEYQAVGPNVTSSSYSEAERQTLRYCTLNLLNLSRICVKSMENYSGDRCFLFKNEPKTRSCLTTLSIPSAANPRADSSQLVSQAPGLEDLKQTADNSKATQIDDPVLSLIDNMKSSWLRLRSTNLTERFARMLNLNEANDSVWLELGAGKQYKIYTSHLVKFAMLSASACIVVLLVAMFVLLTYLAGSDRLAQSRKRQANHDSASSNGSGDHDSSQGSLLTDKSSSCRTQSDNCGQPTETICSGSYSRSSYSAAKSSSNDTQEETVIERQQITEYPSRLDVGHLLMQHQAQCSTPSSSLAPSSVETAETLQAVDSIQTTLQQSDQLTPTNQSAMDLFLADERWAQQPQPPLATVMRMVKSNSANFANQHQQQAVGAYGTLSSRYADHASLRARLGSSSNYSMYAAARSSRQQPAPVVADSQEHDPATLSLLSINSALSAANLAPSVATSPAAPLTSAGEASGASGSQQLLCHYHRLSRLEQHLADEYLTANVILEQEEDNNLLLSLADANHDNFPPPPPLSRAIEALERGGHRHAPGTQNRQ